MPADDQTGDHGGSGVGLLDWVLERYAADWLDRSRLTARAVLDHGILAILRSNAGRTPTSINGVG
jgi:hypothetical protein